MLFTQTNTIAKTIAESHGITEQEYQRICELLGRQPNEVEAGIFGVMWSEHCGYKHSRTTLVRLHGTNQYPGCWITWQGGCGDLASQRDG